MYDLTSGDRDIARFFERYHAEVSYLPGTHRPFMIWADGISPSRPSRGRTFMEAVQDCQCRLAEKPSVRGGVK